MTFIDEYDKMANQEAMEIFSCLMLKEKIKLEKHGFAPTRNASTAKSSTSCGK
jgi:hypothetical protein